jgi:hypothetical protein
VTQYHFLDDSGDPGLRQVAGSSSYFALAMVQMPERTSLAALAEVRKTFHLPPEFEFKYHKTTTAHKLAFFKAIQKIVFRVRAVVADKSHLDRRLALMSGQDFMIEFAARLIVRASELDIGRDVLIIDGTTPAFRRQLRIRLSQESRFSGRARPFSKIISGDSRREDGLQLADMIAGAAARYVIADETTYYQTFAHKVVDLWRVPARK